MHVVSSAPAFGMAVVLLGRTCLGHSKRDVKGPNGGGRSVGGIGSLGDRSGMETLRTLLLRGEPEIVRPGAIDKIKGLKTA